MKKAILDFTKLPKYRTFNTEPSMVRPEFEEELEINNIMDRYIKTGYMPLNEIAPTFGDFSLPLDFETMQDKILTAKAAYINLPLEIRDQYTTAESLIKAISDPHEKSRLEALGVFQKPQAPLVEPVPSVDSDKVAKNKKVAEQPAS